MSSSAAFPAPFDVFVVGGGINGAGIARDAAGRGLKVGLADMDDFASATSSASTKLIHGGLRYLEHYEFRLVRESLMEREVVLETTPHLAETLRFVLPHEPHLRPRWMLRIGLFLYDHLDPGMTLPKSAPVDLHGPLGAGLKDEFRHGFAYSDGRIDDSRLVIANLRDARANGASIHARHRVVAARRVDGAGGQRLWELDLVEDGADRRIRVLTRTLVNAAGPWVKQFLESATPVRTPKDVKLVKGSHIVVPRLYEGEHAYILQNRDGRVGFLVPYLGDYTLIGTTDVEIDGEPGPTAITPDEIDYLCRLVNHYLERAVSPDDVVWSFAGVRPLFDDGKGNPSKVTRDYVLEIDDVRRPGFGRMAPLLSVFGGKLTTYRRLAEHALRDLRPYLPGMGPAWTEHAPLPGGNFVTDSPVRTAEAAFATFVEQLVGARPGLPRDLLVALARRHGTESLALTEGAASVADLGRHFGGFLYEREVERLIVEEWALEADDVLWRRTKEGIRMSPEKRQALADWLAARRGLTPPTAATAGAATAATVAPEADAEPAIEPALAH